MWAQRRRNPYGNGFFEHQQRIYWMNYQQQLMQEYQRRQFMQEYHSRQALAWLLQRQRLQRAADIFNANYFYQRETRNDPRFEWHSTPDGGRERAWFLPRPNPEDRYMEEDNILSDWTGGYLPRQGTGPDPMPQPERPPTPRPVGYGVKLPPFQPFKAPDWRKK